MLPLKPYAFVCYQDLDSAERAMNQLNGTSLPETSSRKQSATLYIFFVSKGINISFTFKNDVWLIFNLWEILYLLMLIVEANNHFLFFSHLRYKCIESTLFFGQWKKYRILNPLSWNCFCSSSGTLSITRPSPGAGRPDKLCDRGGGEGVPVCFGLGILSRGWVSLYARHQNITQYNATHQNIKNCSESILGLYRYVCHTVDSL